MKKLIQSALIISCCVLTGQAIAGAVGGPKQSRDTVSGHSSDTFIVTFQKNERALVTVSGDGSSDIDCKVFDSKGYLVAADLDNTDSCVLSWTPAWTGKFRIMIYNMGKNDNEYYLQTN